MADITFQTGVIDAKVNGGRTIRFNPSDVGFADMLFSLASKIEAIDNERKEKTGKSSDPAKVFEYFRASDKRMRQEVDSMFGDGFCDDVFPGVRLMAMVDGLTVIENFIFAVIDQMDADITENMEKRNEKIEKYTAKYAKHKKM